MSSEVLYSQNKNMVVLTSSKQNQGSSPDRSSLWHTQPASAFRPCLWSAEGDFLLGFPSLLFLLIRDMVILKVSVRVVFSVISLIHLLKV